MTPNTPKNFVQPYLFFGGVCDEALAFYKTAIGAEVLMITRFNESPEPMPEGMLEPGFENKIMHAAFRVGETVLMASDGTCHTPGKGFDGFRLSLTLPDEAAVDRSFAALAEGGEVTMPLGKTFWSGRFGMVTDRFGLGWMLTVPIEQP